MNAGEQEERELIARAVACARAGEATHWPTVAGYLVAEIDQLQAELAELREELRRAGRVIAGAAGSFASPLPVGEAVPQGRIRVTDPATANLINKAKAAHEVMLRSQDEMDEANACIEPYIQAAMRADWSAEARRIGNAEQRLSEVAGPVEHNIQDVRRVGEYVRLVCTCGWWGEPAETSDQAVESLLGLHRAHPESYAAELATDVHYGYALGSTHGTIGAILQDQSGDSTGETGVSRQDNGS